MKGGCHPSHGLIGEQIREISRGNAKAHKAKSKCEKLRGKRDEGQSKIKNGNLHNGRKALQAEKDKKGKERLGDHIDKIQIQIRQTDKGKEKPEESPFDRKTGLKGFVFRHVFPIRSQNVFAKCPILFATLQIRLEDPCGINPQKNEKKRAENKENAAHGTEGANHCGIVFHLIPFRINIGIENHGKLGQEVDRGFRHKKYQGKIANQIVRLQNQIPVLTDGKIMESLEGIVAKKPVHPELRYEEEEANRQPRAFNAGGKGNGAGKELEHARQGQKQRPLSGGCNSLLQKRKLGKAARYEKKSDKIGKNIQSDQFRIDQK